MTARPSPLPRSTKVARAVERKISQQRFDFADGRWLVVRCVCDARADRLRVEIAQKQECFRRDAALGIEALTGAAARDTNAGRRRYVVHDVGIRHWEARSGV